MTMQFGYFHPSPVFGAEAYFEVLLDNKDVPNALISSFIVVVPATIIPITVAAFAAYAFSWMQFPGRDWLFIIVVSLMVVPTQLAFLPILQGFNGLATWATSLKQWMTDCEITNTCEFPTKFKFTNKKQKNILGREFMVISTKLTVTAAVVAATCTFGSISHADGHADVCATPTKLGDMGSFPGEVITVQGSLLGTDEEMFLNTCQAK